jgi:hypothetical protein
MEKHLVIGIPFKTFALVLLLLVDSYLLQILKKILCKVIRAIFQLIQLD